MMDSEQVRGLYLVPPHGELIATGAKSAIAKSRYVPGDRLFDLRGDWMLVSKVDGVGLGLGDMTLGEPVERSLEDFDTKQSEHCVERADRMRWWPECETLWEYPIERFKSYVNPLAVDVPAGVQTVMSSVVRQDVGAGSPATIDTIDTSIKARSSRSQCMECKSPPVIDVHWADGRGRAWFCLKHFKEWIEDDDREIVRAFYLSDGEAPVKIGEGEQVLKLGERLTPKGLAVRVGSLIAKEGVKAQGGRSDETIESVEPEGDKVQPEVEGAKETTDMQKITVLLDDEQLTNEKVYSKLSDANPALRGIKPPINLEQANLIASWADAMEATEDGPESPWGAAIAQFKDIYEKNEAGDGWVERAKTGDKAKWSPSYISSLPDTAFLLIESGGEKKDGITRPLSLRHLPVRGKDGEADPGHLRNALARMSQMKDKEGNSFPAATIEKLREKAQKLLTESKKARGDYCICEKCASVVEHKSDTPCNEIECGECDGMMRSATQAEIETAGVQAGRAVTAAVMSSVDASVKAEGKDIKEGRRVRQDKVGLLQKLKDELHEFLSSLGEFVSWATYDDKPKDNEPDEGEFDIGTLLSIAGKKVLEQGSTAFAFKALDGQTWWFQWTTNAFKDREGEIFTTQSINDFVDRKENDDIKGEFWFWHTPGSKFGTVRLQAIVGRFLAQAGPFDDTAVGRAFKEFFSKYPHSHPDIAPEGWGTSHKYSYKSVDRAVDGVYNWFDMRESTVLPGRFASNPYSPMPQILGGMKMNDEQRKAFVAVGGEEFVNLIVNIGKESTKKLEGEVAFKEVTPEQDDKAGGNYAARIKEIAKGIEDEGLKGQVEVFCAKLEKAMPMAEKETDEAEKAKTDMAAMAGQLRMLAGKVGGDSGKKLTAIAEEMAQAYGKKEDAETTTKVEAEKAVEPEPEPEVNALTREEVAGAMKAIVEVLRDEIKESTKATVAEITEALKPLVDEVKSLKVADEVKVAEKAAETPAASLSSLLQSVIGDPATFVEAGSKLAVSGPKETPSDANAVTGIPFVDAFIGGTDQASQKPTAGGN